jgi:hypothetical protein
MADTKNLVINTSNTTSSGIGINYWPGIIWYFLGTILIFLRIFCQTKENKTIKIVCQVRYNDTTKYRLAVVLLYIRELYSIT